MGPEASYSKARRLSSTNGWTQQLLHTPPAHTKPPPRRRQRTSRPRPPHLPHKLARNHIPSLRHAPQQRVRNLIRCHGCVRLLDFPCRGWFRDLLEREPWRADAGGGEEVDGYIV